MAINIEEIVAKPAAAAPAPAAIESTVAPADAGNAEEGAEIPDEVLQIPAFQGLLEGRPAAVYDIKGSKTPAIKAIADNIKPLAEAGIGFYGSKDGTTFVMYNGQFITTEEIAAADEAGKLTEIAEPLGAVMGAYDAVLNEGSAPAAPAAGGVADAVINATLGLPSPSGNNHLVLNDNDALFADDFSATDQARDLLEAFKASSD